MWKNLQVELLDGKLAKTLVSSTIIPFGTFAKWIWFATHAPNVATIALVSNSKPRACVVFKMFVKQSLNVH